MQQSIRQISELLRKGSLSPVELTEECLARIEKLNPMLNAFITVTAESARAQARQAEADIRHGDWRGPLHGVPLALKDLIDTAGVRTTAASSQFKDRIPSEDAEVVRRLKEAGAVLLGKQNLHECAYGGSSMVSYFGEVRNAWNSGTHYRRVFRRLGDRSRRGLRFRRNRHRHRWLRSGTGGPVWGRRPEADLWQGQCPRRNPTFCLPRSRRADRADG